MHNFLVIIVYLLIGVSLNHLLKFPKETSNILNLFVIYISLPALVLIKVPQLNFSSELLTPVIFCWSVLILSAAVVLLLSKIFKWNKNITGCLLLLVPLGNTSFLGIPMVEAFFGSNAVPYALLYDQPGSFLALATYGSVIISIYGNSEEKINLKSIIKRVFTFPPFIALVIAFALKSVTYPFIILSIFESLAATLVPVVMIAVGFQLTLKMRREVIKPLSAGLFIKLVAVPLTALLTMRVSGLENEIINVSIFESGMPPMVSAGAMAIIAGLAPQLAASLVGFGILLSFITLPVLFYLL